MICFNKSSFPRNAREALIRHAGASATPGNAINAVSVASEQETETAHDKKRTKTITPVPEDNQSHKGPGSAPGVPLDTTKGHRDDEKQNIREQAEHGNLTQNTSNRRQG